MRNSRRLVLLGLLATSGCKLDCPPEGVAAPKEPTQATALTRQQLETDGLEPVLVRYRPAPAGRVSALAASARAERVARLGGRVKHHWPELDMAAVRLSREAQAALASDPEVLSVEPDRPVHALGLPTPPTAWVLGGTPVPTGSPEEYTPHLKMVQAPEVWDADGDGTLDPGAPTGEGVRVCVIDSGIDDRHPELQVAFAGGADGRDFVDGDSDPRDLDVHGTWGGGHGTHVAGIIAAQLASGAVVRPGQLPAGGMVGVAPGVTLLIARVLDLKGSGSTSDVIAALQWCVSRGANIVSLSLGSPERNDAEEAAFAAAWEKGVLSLAASGNNGTDDPTTDPGLAYPGGYPSVMAVGAVRLDGTHPTFSQKGPTLSLVAPGVSVPSSVVVGSAAFGVLEVDGASLRNEALAYTGTTETSGPLVYCGLGADDESCQDIRACGFVALVERGGGVQFKDKVKHVQAQGARAVIVVNNDPEDDEALAFTLGAPDRWPVTLAVPTTSRAALMAQVGRTVKLQVKGADYELETGTSMATPFATGVAALVLSKSLAQATATQPALTNAQLRDLLQRSARNLGEDTGRDDVYGYGLVQARAALELLASGQ